MSFKMRRILISTANIETDLYMEVPKGFDIEGKRSKYALKLLKNLYSQK